MKSTDCVHLIFGPENDMEVTLFYILPTLPLSLVDDPSMGRHQKAQLEAVLSKNEEMADRILGQAKKGLQQKGFLESLKDPHDVARNGHVSQ